MTLPPPPPPAPAAPTPEPAEAIRGLGLGTLDPNSNLAAVFRKARTARSAAANKNYDVDAADGPPLMFPHEPKEFRFAHRTLAELVVDSRHFPVQASRSSWFRSRAHAETEAHLLAAVARAEAERTAAEVSDKGDGEADDETSADDALLGSFTDPRELDLLDRGAADFMPRSRSADAVDRAKLDAEVEARAEKDAEARAIEEAEARGRAKAMEEADEEGREERDSSLSNFAPIPAVDEGDVEWGELLGEGAFCEVRAARLKGEEENLCASDPPRVYAMKYLSPTKTAPPPWDGLGPNPQNKVFERFLSDLAVEARFLALLSHEHIIKLHHVGHGSLEHQYNCPDEDDTDDEDDLGYVRRPTSYLHRFGFFLLLDSLRDTLADRIETVFIPAAFDACEVAASRPGQRPAPSSGRSGMLRRVIRRGSSMDESGGLLDTLKIQLIERLEGLGGVASAVSYLHDRNIISRDVKPDNIGFYRRPHQHCSCGKRDVGDGQECTCYTDVPKLFDFGLAKELKMRYLQFDPAFGIESDVKTFKLTARAGSRRYMAPEVAFGRPYNEKADVYSLGINLYQVASLVTPFEGYSLSRHQEDVLRGGERPDAAVLGSKKSLAWVRKGGKGLPASYVDWRAERDPFKRSEALVLRTKAVWPKDLGRLMEACWQEDLRKRPGMYEVCRSLDAIVAELRVGAEGGEAKGRISGMKKSLLGLTSLRRQGTGTTAEWVGSDEESRS
ncbi:hypothetical protein ACHAWF_016358 [Thalassiosira exigua]